MKTILPFLMLALLPMAPVHGSTCVLDGLELPTTEAAFHALLDHAERLFAPEVASKGGVLSLRREWSFGVLNGNAWRSGADWRIHVYGGLTPLRGFTHDAFALLVCHEIGHHLGGAPLAPDLDGLSAEGQADYFATAKCLRRLWAGENHEAALAGVEIPTSVTNACEDSAHRSGIDALLCARSALAGLSMASMLKHFTPYAAAEPSLETPDPAVVEHTLDSEYPGYQCRLDTYLQGAICGVPETEAFSSADETIGACGPGVGARPSCWYRRTP